MKQMLLSFAIIIVSSTFTIAQQKIPIEEAANRIGDTVTICSKVFSTHYKDKSNEATFIFLGAPQPNAPLMLVINADKRKFFDYRPEKDLLNREICVTGRLDLVKGKPQITVWKQDEIKIHAPKPD
ncbi:MAG: hypothetical protein JWQ96_3125 [Segetibacter sp.]|nr:hypothetical protein [Segetibacter sp.]